VRTVKTLTALPIFFFFLFLSLSTVKAQECVEPYENLEITNDTTLCGGTYYLNDTDSNGVIQVTGSNLTLDCNGTVIIGNSTECNSFCEYGFAFWGSNIVLKNCEVQNYGKGFGIENWGNPSNITFENCTAKFNKLGFFSNWVSDIYYINDTADSNSNDGFFNSNGINFTFNNVIAINTSTGIELINITEGNIDGFSVGGGDVTNQGNWGVRIDDSNNVTIKNGVIDSVGKNEGSGSHITWDNVTLSNIGFSAIQHSGNYFVLNNSIVENAGITEGWPAVESFGTDNIYIGYSSFIDNRGSGIITWCNSTDAVIEHNKIETSYDSIGIMVQSRNAVVRNNNITLTNSTGWPVGIVGTPMYNQSIYDNNVFVPNKIGLSMNREWPLAMSCGSGVVPDVVYNNIFDAQTPVELVPTVNYTDYYNTSYRDGVNIWNSSLGYIGGNLYTTPSNNGFSDTCNDVNSDGFCDSPYTLAENNTDYLPIAKVLGYYLAVTFNYNSVGFGQLLANSTNNPAPNQLNGIYNVTVDTNANYNVKASGLDFTPALAISNLKFDTNSTAENLNSDQAVALSNTVQTIDTYPSATTVNYHGYWLSIPAGQYATTYNTTVTINYGKA
jgi:hypothetical protein